MSTILLFLLLIAIVVFWFFLRTKHETFLENEPTVNRLRSKLLPVFPEFNHVKLMKGTSSYTINKQKIYLCTESDGVTYDDNMLTYVALHELAHTLCPEIGHGDRFKDIFQSLLDRAERHHLYDPNRPRVENYCKAKK